MKTAELISSLFSDSSGELRIGGVPVKSLAAQFGTPLFVYDESVIVRKWRLLRTTFPERFDLYYSLKANPNLNILALFLKQGAGLEVASAGELYQAQQAGCAPDRILFAGPGKTQSELELALSIGIGEIHAESLNELLRIAALAKRLDRVARIAIRVNPQADSQGGAMRMGGKATPFGIDEEQLDSALDHVLAEPLIKLEGIHLFSGTQILDANILLGQYRKGLEVARKVARRLDKPLASVDFGGGLGVPYFLNDAELDMQVLQKGLSDLCQAVADDPVFRGTKFVVEPGRYLVAESGVYLSRVVDVKVSRGQKFIVLDGGMHHHLAASGNLGQTIKRNFPVAIANRLTEQETEIADLVGPLCTPLDALARGVHLPKAEVDDLVAVFQSGAYARAASPLNFLSHPAPPEVLVSQGKARLIRRRGEASDYIRDIDSIPECKGAYSRS